MSRAPRWAYARARMMARAGERPDEAAWRVVEATTDLASFGLALAKTAAADWVEALEPDPTRARVEAALRDQWVGRALEIASWAPESWAPAARWLEALPYLGLVERALLEPEVPAAWSDDVRIGELMAAEPDRRAAALDALGWSALAPAATEREASSRHDVVAAWRAELLARLPADDPDGRADVERLVEWIAAHRGALARSSEASSVELRRRLQRRLHEGFRRGASVDSAAGALFHYAGLVVFEGQRVRAGLLSRLELPDVREAQAWV